MRILDLMVKDLLQLVRDWRAFLFLLLMPILFTLLFGFAFGGFSADEDTRLPVGLINLDQDELGIKAVSFLEASEVIRIVDYSDKTEAELSEDVDKGEIAGGILIPVGFSNSWIEGDYTPVSLIVDSAAASSYTVETEINTAMNRIQVASRAASVLETIKLQKTGEGIDESTRGEVISSALILWENPPAKVSLSKQGVNADEPENAFTQSAPGMMLQFAIAGLMGAAGILVTERKTRALQRLLTTNFSKTGILMGHFLAMFAMIFIQLFVLNVFGALVLRLNYFEHIPETLLLMTATALMVAAIGLLIGNISKNQDQAVVFSLIPMFVFSGLGGAWMPLEFTGETFQKIGHFTPIAWAMDGFKNILIRNMGFEGVWLPVLVLLGFALGFFILGILSFRTE